MQPTTAKALSFPTTANKDRRFTLLTISFVLMMRLLFLGLLLLPQLLQAQVPVGQWRVHLPYSFATCVETTPDLVYVGTRHAMFSLNKDDGEIRTLSRINGMTDQGITALRYSPRHQTLIIAYESGNIDLLHRGKFTMIDAIVRANIPGLKRINHILLEGRFAYLSCAFGIVELDLDRSEIRNTFIIGPNGSRLQVYALAGDAQNFYAATDLGMFVAPRNAPNLSNFAFWQPESSRAGESFRHLAAYQNAIYSIRADSLLRYENGSWTASVLDAGFPNTSITARNGLLQVTNVFRVISIDSTGDQKRTFSNPNILNPRQAIQDGNFIWMADEGGGLFRFRDGASDQFLPSGPVSEKAVHIHADRQGVVISAGGFSSVLSNRFQSEGAFLFANEQWKQLNRNSLTGVPNMVDVLQARYHPSTPGRLYLLPWGRGLYELENNDIKTIYDPTNSSLEYIPGSIDPNTGRGDTRIGGIDFDRDGNMWVSNYAASKPIARRKTDGSWESFSLGEFTEVIDMVVDNSGNKWVRSRSGGIVGLNRDNTRFRNVNTPEGSGSLPSPIVNCLALDKQGALWIGTNEGPAVFFNPNVVFTRDRFDAQQIRIQQEQFVGFLLGNEVVTAIAIDGADRKWFGTNNGVWLFSADGTRQIHHFTRENSPLLSNVITSLAIHPQTGEVFIGTDRGVISYRGTATEGVNQHSEVQVFPNPVRPEYDGFVSVNGLVTNAWIKITDLSGQLVFQTRADGGQISWNGRDLQGNRVATGVYLVMATSDLGEETVAAKIVFIR